MRFLFLCAVLFAAAAGATEVYRWVDAEGQAHYSDQWRPDAEKVRIDDSPGFSAPRPVPRAADTPRVPAATTAYQSLEIISPSQEEVLWNIEGQLQVSLRVNPALQPDHDLRLYLDGEQQEIPAASTEVQLSEVFRGVHTLKAEVVNEAGAVLITSPTRTFAVRQTSIASPTNPNRPTVNPLGP